MPTLQKVSFFLVHDLSNDHVIVHWLKNNIVDLRKEMNEFAVQQERNAALDHQIENEMREMRLNIKKPAVHKVTPLFFFNLELENWVFFRRYWNAFQRFKKCQFRSMPYLQESIWVVFHSLLENVYLRKSYLAKFHKNKSITNVSQRNDSLNLS